MISEDELKRVEELLAEESSKNSKLEKKFEDYKEKTANKLAKVFEK